MHNHIAIECDDVALEFAMNFGVALEHDDMSAMRFGIAQREVSDSRRATHHGQACVTDRIGEGVAEFDLEALGNIEAGRIDPRSVLTCLFDGLWPGGGSRVEERQRIANAMDQLFYRFERFRRRVKPRGRTRSRGRSKMFASARRRE